MGIVRRHSIWLTAIQYVGMIIGYANTVLLFPNFLTTDEFGLTRILLTVAIVISQFAQIGTPAMIIRFYPYLQKKTLYFGFIICSVGLTLVFGFFELFKDWIISIYEVHSALFVNYFYLLVPFSVAMVYYNLFDAYLKAIYKNVVSASLPFVLLRIIWLVLILMYSNGNIDFDAFIIAYSMSYTLIAFIALVYIGLLRALPNDLNVGISDKEYLRRIARFNSFNILSGLSSFMINRVDMLMLSGMKGLTAVSVYAIASAMASVIRIPTSAIARVAPSLVAEAFKANDMAQIETLYKKSSINQLILSLGAFLLILLNLNVLLLFLDDVYHDSFIIFIFLGLAQVIDTGVGINGHIMVNSSYYKTDAYLSMALLVLTLISNYFFIPIYGTLGAAVATLLAILAYNVARLVFLRVKLRLNPFTAKTAETLLIFTVVGLIAYFTPSVENIWVATIQKNILFAGLAIPLLFWRRLSPDMNQLATDLIQRFKK